MISARAVEQTQQAKLKIKTQEGHWQLLLERRANINFQPDLATRLTLADCGEKEDGDYLLFNIGQKLHVYRACAIDSKEPAALVHFMPPNGGPACYPTCHSHTQTLDEYDLLVGLNTGEVVLMSLRAQLRVGSTLSRPATAISLNFDGSVNASRCVAAVWVPGSQGRSFITAHRDGGMYLHHKVVGSSSDSKLLARTNSQQTLRPPVAVLQPAGAGGGATAAAPSPDGSLVAVACKDGILRIYDVSTAALVAGFKSYYGGLLCCAWSPDGRYVAAGGEDDLVSVYGLSERCVVAVGQGHCSWVSAVAFDAWLCHPIEPAAAAPTTPQHEHLPGDAVATAAGDTLYRLASLGQDCQLLLWDVVVSEDTLAAVPSGLSPFRSGRENQSSPTSAAASTLHREQAGGSGAPGGGLPACIVPSLPRAEMPLMPSVAQQKIHAEPLSDIFFTANTMLTACHGGNIKAWRRPATGLAGSQADMDTSSL